MSAHTLSHWSPLPTVTEARKVTVFIFESKHYIIVPQSRHTTPCSPTPLSSTPGLLTQRSACSIFPSRVTAGLAGLMLATARLVLDWRVSSAAPICLAKARASGLSPLPLGREQKERAFENWKKQGIDYRLEAD